MSEFPLPSEAPRAVELFNLPPKDRALERVRLVNEMRVEKVGDRDQPAWPVDLVGDAEHAAAFLDLVYQTTPTDRLGATLKFQGAMMVDPVLAERINQGNGVLTVKGGQETTVISISQDKATGKFHCRFGYSAKGTSIEKSYGNNVNINITNNPDFITDESIFRLYRLTGNPSFTEILGIRAELKGRGATASAQFKPIDPKRHYATLGFNPYALRFLDEETFETLVKGMKREVARKLHPDVAHPIKSELDYLKRMLAACDILESKDKRNEYSTWLND